jgi:short-subunit dehydrogenase
MTPAGREPDRSAFSRNGVSTSAAANDGAGGLTDGIHIRRADAYNGAVVNVVSTAAAAALPIIPSYSVSKAASWSLSQSLRALLAPRGVSVHAVLAGPMNTEMSREFPVPKASTERIAA